MSPVSLNKKDTDIADILKVFESHPPIIRTFREGSLFGMVVGAVVLLGGFSTFFLSLSGTVEWIFEAGSISSKLINASPGVVFSIIGLLIMWRYKPKVRTDIEIKINKSFSKINPDIQTVEKSIKYSGSASSPITSRRY